VKICSLASGIDATAVNAVLVSHEHIDHIRSAGAFARKFKVPVMVSHLLSVKAEKYLHKAQLMEFEAGSALMFRDVVIDPFPIAHDACDPVGFVLESREGRCASATDLGMVTRLVTEKLRNCRALNLESNHDVEMLMNGPYPWELKQRIKSRHGHHSEVNNHPDHVLRTTGDFLRGQNICAPGIVIGDQQSASAVMTI